MVQMNKLNYQILAIMLPVYVDLLKHQKIEWDALIDNKIQKQMRYLINSIKSDERVDRTVDESVSSKHYFHCASMNPNTHNARAYTNWRAYGDSVTGFTIESFIPNVYHVNVKVILALTINVNRTVDMHNCSNCTTDMNSR